MKPPNLRNQTSSMDAMLRVISKVQWGMQMIFGYFHDWTPILRVACSLVRIIKHILQRHTLQQDWTTSQNIVKYSTLNIEPNWEDLCIQWRNQQTLTIIPIPKSKESDFQSDRWCFTMTPLSQHTFLYVNIINTTWKEKDKEKKTKKQKKREKQSE